MLVLFLATLGCSALTGTADPAQGTAPEEAPRSAPTREGRGEVLEIDFRGTRRGAWVHVPASVADGAEKVPAILMHHGGHGAGGRKAAKLWTGQVEKDFILLFPDGQTVEDSAGWMPVKGELDYNVRFVEQLLDAALERYPIDPDRVFAVGWSSGGQQTLRLACLSSDRFQAFTVVSQTMELDTLEACRKTSHTPRPIQLILDSGDRKNPWEGRGGHPKGSSPGRIGIQETVDFFVKANGCSPEVKPTKLHGDVDERRYQGCSKGDVRWLLVHGNTHAWPGGPEGVQELSATDETVAFFREHGM